MKYIFSRDIRFKTCVDLSFLVNIKTNSVFQINTNTLNYLQECLSDGLTEEKLCAEELFFKNFVIELQKREILEVVKDEC